MITNKKEYVEYYKADNEEYLKKSFAEKIIGCIVHYPDYEIYQFKKNLRKAEYAFNSIHKNKIKWLIALYYERKKNKYGDRLGIEIEINCFGKGLQIYHGAGIVVNPQARIGENCKLHGGNCIGNNGKTQEVPVLGNNLDIGFGACIVGGVQLGNDICIGSNAVVVKNCFRENAVLVGIPAKEIK
ncbi:Serine acetyltransferase [uncultured Blautia sp.]